MTQDSVAIPAKEYYAKRTRNYLAARGLEEEVLAAVVITPAGATQDRLTRSIGGAIGSAAGAAVGGGGQDSGLLSRLGGNLGRDVAADVNSARGVPVGRGSVNRGDVDLPKNGVLVLTSARLLVFRQASMGFFTAKPKAAHSDIPLAEVVGISDLAEAKVAGVKSAQVVIVLSSGWSLRMEFPSVAVKNGTALIAELARRIGA
jgi:hypothetical protein